MKVNGNIKDSKGEDIISAHVTLISGERANKIGSVSNLDGNFTIENDIIEPNSMFEITYMGFEPQKFTATDLQDANVILYQQGEILNEGVVVTNKKPIAKTIGLTDKKGTNGTTQIVVVASIIIGGYLAYKKFKK